jgi:PD-(D/E)XK nuclease superfamily
LDVVITYLHQKFVAELKLWHGLKAHEEGLQQLSDYLDRQQLKVGYLLIFDHSLIKNWRSEWIDFDGKKIFAVWV